MTAWRLLGAVAAGLGVVAFGGGLTGAGVLLPVCCLIALTGIGELWLRALTGEALAPVARIGLAAAAGLVSLPLIAVVLHLSGVPIAARPLTVGLAALAAVLGTVVLIRERGARPAGAGLGRSLAAVAIPAALALIIGAAAVLAYAGLPHPSPPGYTSLALNGWAATIDGPVDIPARGLRVPIRVSSAGRPTVTEPLTVIVGTHLAGIPRPLEVTADTTRSVVVHVPAPPNNCLYRIKISLGAASTTFYGRGTAAC